MILAGNIQRNPWMLLKHIGQLGKIGLGDGLEHLAGDPVDDIHIVVAILGMTVKAQFSPLNGLVQHVMQGSPRFHFFLSAELLELAELTGNVVDMLLLLPGGIGQFLFLGRAQVPLGMGGYGLLG